MKINQWHRAVFRDYAEGYYEHLSDQDHLTSQDLHNLGDGLLVFILVELCESEDCTGLNVARRRMETARDDLSVALRALEMIQTEIDSRQGSTLH